MTVISLPIISLLVGSEEVLKIRHDASESCQVGDRALFSRMNQTIIHSIFFFGSSALFVRSRQNFVPALSSEVGN